MNLLLVVIIVIIVLAVIYVLVRKHELRGSRGSSSGSSGSGPCDEDSRAVWVCVLVLIAVIILGGAAGWGKYKKHKIRSGASSLSSMSGL